MKNNFLKHGLIHFIGIGGIGMSGIAESMHDLGYKIQGSDINFNLNVKRIHKKGIKIFLARTVDDGRTYHLDGQRHRIF